MDTQMLIGSRFEAGTETEEPILNPRTGATILNLPSGKSTTTLESKTNFLRPIRIGDVARAICEPLHRGRTTQIWHTRILRGDGKLAAIVTQTQIVLEWKD